MLKSKFRKKVCRTMSLFLALLMVLGNVSIVVWAQEPPVYEHDHYNVDYSLPELPLFTLAPVPSSPYHSAYPEYYAYHILTSTLQEPVGMQGFEGDYEIAGPNEPVEIIVMFRTPSAVALRLMQERGISHSLALSRASFEDQALSAHDAFWGEFGHIGRGRAGDSVEVLSEWSSLINGVAIRVAGEMVERIAALPEVYGVFPNVEIFPDYVYDDINSATTTTAVTIDDLMPEARELFELDFIHNNLGITGEGVQVAVLDWGVEHDHPALANFLEDGYIRGWHGDRVLDNDHGMMVTGGVIAMAPGIDLWHYRIDTDRFTTSIDRSVTMIEAAHRDGADVMSLSFSLVTNMFIPVLTIALNTAVLDDVVVVISAGNRAVEYGSFSIAAPGPEHLAITVGAGNAGGMAYVYYGDTIADFSSRGPAPVTYHIKPDIVAPGNRIKTLTFMADGGYREGGGTSIATPIIAGVAALILHEFPEATPAEVKARIMNSARPLDGMNPNSVFTVGAGFVRPLEALQNHTVVTVEHDIIMTEAETDNDTSISFVTAPATMASLSFGNAATLVFQHQNRKTMPLTIRNTSDTARAYTISHYFTNNPEDVAQLSFSQQTITVGAGQYAIIDVTMSLRHGLVTVPSNPRMVYEGYMEEQQRFAPELPPLPRVFYEGYVYVREGGNTVARLPFGLVNTHALIAADSATQVSSWEELRDAINNAPANEPTTIQILNDIAADGAAIVIANQNISLIGNERWEFIWGSTPQWRGAPTRIRQAIPGQRHFIVSGDQASLTLGPNITLCGGWGNSGGVVVADGALRMIDGSAIENCLWSGTSGGAVLMTTHATFVMEGGTIRNNAADVGGGVFVSSSATGAFTMTGGEIINNYASFDGGGIFSTLFDYAETVSYTSYGNLYISAAARFADNTAGNGASAPPHNQLAHITPATTSVWDYVLNNYDINYRGFLGQTPVMRVSMWEELRNAIDNTPPNVAATIQITDDITAPDDIIGNTIQIASNRNITLISDNDTTMRTITQTNLGQRHFSIGNGRSTNLTLGSNITLSGGDTNNTNNSGGVNISEGMFMMTDGSIIENCRWMGSRGGAVSVSAGWGATFTTFVLDGGTIRNNSASEGGGIHLFRGVVHITRGTIIGNTAVNGGGGVHVLATEAGAFTMTGGEIISNHAGTNGGGIYSTLANHSATVPVTAYRNLQIGANAHFSDNTAGNGHSLPPDNQLPHIAFRTSSIWHCVLNNYDINYTGRIVILPPLTVTVTPVGNGTVEGTGSFHPGAEVTLTAIPAEGYRFIDWDGDFTSTDNPLIFYMPGEDVVLTATFEPRGQLFPVLIDGVQVGTYAAGEPVEINAGLREGYIFTHWMAIGAVLNDISAAITGFTMPSRQVTIVTRWQRIHTPHLVVPGDVNSDGSVDIGDVNMLSLFLVTPNRAAFMLMHPNFNYFNANVTGSGVVTQVDLALLRRHVMMGSCMITVPLFPFPFD